MKSAVVVLVLAFVVTAECNATDSGNELTNDEGNSVTKLALDDTTVTSDLEDATTKNTSEEGSTVTNASTGESVTSAISTKPDTTSAPAVSQNKPSASSVNQTSTLTDDRRRLSTEVDKSKCESLGLEMPNAAGCKCYKQKSAGTDTPRGYCYYYECPGTPPAISKHKCEWKEE